MTSATMSGEPSISQGKGSMPLASAENLEGVFMPEMSLLPLGTVVDGKGSGPGWGQLRFMVAGYFPVVKSDGECLDCTAAPWPLGCVDIDDGTKKSAVSPSLSGERSRAGRRGHLEHPRFSVYGIGSGAGAVENAGVGTSSRASGESVPFG